MSSARAVSDAKALTREELEFRYLSYEDLWNEHFFVGCDREMGRRAGLEEAATWLESEGQPLMAEEIRKRKVAPL